MNFPLIDVTVVKATDIIGTTSSKKFCVYLRLQNQGVRTNACKLIGDQVMFNEKFKFRYNPQHKNNRTRNELFIELWSKGFMNNNCVSISWVHLSAFNLVQGVPLTLNINGSFEGSSAKVMVTILPTNFSYKGSIQNNVIKDSTRNRQVRRNSRHAQRLLNRPTEQEARSNMNESLDQ